MVSLDPPQLASGLNDPPRSGALRWGERAGEGAPPGAPAHRRPPDAQDDHLETLSTSTCCSRYYFQSCEEFIDATRAHVGESCSMPSSAVGSGQLQRALYCFLFIPPSVAWAAGLVIAGEPFKWVHISVGILGKRYIYLTRFRILHSLRLTLVLNKHWFSNEPQGGKPFGCVGALQLQ